jgi:hypothetical protein
VAKARREAVLQGLVGQVRLGINFVGCLAHISTVGYSDATIPSLAPQSPWIWSVLRYCYMSWDFGPDSGVVSGVGVRSSELIYKVLMCQWVSIAAVI